jgi:hypothetical protein
MKPCHAAALALVGWYIIQPPVAGPQRVDTTAPISRWYFYNERKAPDPKGEKLTQPYALVFGSEEECKAKVIHRQEFLKELAKVLGRDVTLNLALWNNAICISADDPRLKPK